MCIFSYSVRKCTALVSFTLNGPSFMRIMLKCLFSLLSLLSLSSPFSLLSLFPLFSLFSLFALFALCSFSSFTCTPFPLPCPSLSHHTHSTFVDLMAQQEVNHDRTVHYIRLQCVDIFLSNLYSLFTVLLMLQEAYWHILLLFFIEMSLKVLCDICLLSPPDTFSFSVNLGVDGVAYSNIIVSTMLLVYSLCWFVLTYSDYLLIGWSRSLLNLRRNACWTWLRDDWVMVGAWSGLDSAIRNSFYIVFVLRWVKSSFFSLSFFHSFVIILSFFRIIYSHDTCMDSSMHLRMCYSSS